MKIFVFVTRYPNDSNCQANIFAHEQCLMLQRFGHNVIVLEERIEIPSAWNHCNFNEIKLREWEGVQVYTHHVRGIATTKLLSINQRIYIKGMKKVYKTVVQDHGIPDVIYAHFAAKAGVAACMIGPTEGIPVVIIEHGGLVMENSHHNYLRKWLKFTVNNSKTFICVSNTQKKCVENYTGVKKNIIVIPNMVDSSFAYKKLEPNGKFLFFSAGNLNKTKRMDLLIKAFNKAFTHNEPVGLRIAGDGKERGYLETLAASGNHKENIFFLGRLDKEHMINEYTKSSAFVLASCHESFGIAYREALCIGRPVISTDNGGIRDGWNDSFGIIVNVDDLEGLAQALYKVYTNYKSFDLKKISDMCLQYTNPDIVMRKIENILMSCVNL